MRKVMISIVASVALGLSIAGPAAASEVEPAGPVLPAGHTDITAELPDYDQFVVELEASGLPHESTIEDGALISTTYTLPGGLEYTIAHSPRDPRVSGGTNSHGIWLKFTPGEQRLIAEGGGAALAVGICLIPAVGPVVCVVTAAVVAAALSYYRDHGVCGNRLMIYPFVPERNRCA